MFKRVSLSGFRCFDQFSVDDLGRVNLLVGENGAGKTSLLEGIRLLGARGNPLALLASAMERGEYERDESEDGSDERTAALHFAFHGRQAEAQVRFQIDGWDEDATQSSVSAEVFDASHYDPEAPMLGAASSTGDMQFHGMFPEWAIRLAVLGSSGHVEVPINWSPSVARRLKLVGPRFGVRARGEVPVFLRANGVDDAVLGRLWDGVVATPEKDMVVESLRHLEPKIRDIDLRSDTRLPFRSRVVVRIDNGKPSSAPLGSFGEGVTWLFALALGTASTVNKLLLVDDIDAGLHHRAMTQMWTMVIDTARARDMQVFATTHSIDCLSALRRACVAEPGRAAEVRVIRVVKGGSTGITFTAKELDTAIEGEVEVRG